MRVRAVQHASARSKRGVESQSGTWLLDRMMMTFFRCLSTTTVGFSAANDD
jgi:hypothetical protein